MSDEPDTSEVILWVVVVFCIGLFIGIVCGVIRATAFSGWR